MSGPDGVPAVTEKYLRWALANERFEAVFQPIVRVADRVPVAVEALARLQHPARGTIQPDDFVPQMEDAGLALLLADKITMGALSALPDGFLEQNRISVAVNLPLNVLLGQQALEAIDQVRRTSRIPSQCLTIELTESQPVNDIPALQAAIERWGRAGYKLALDDVSPHMPRHRALLDLPFSRIKLDKSAVRACDTPAGRKFITDTTAAARTRGFQVVAEGVEDQADWDLVTNLGADLIQGFMVGKPMPPAELPVWLQAWQG